MQITKGTYDYDITHPNYFDYKGQVTVGTSAMSVNVFIVLNPVILKPEENGNIQMMLVGTSCSISVTSPTSSYVIDWGDGTTENASGTGSKSYSHTYTDNGYHNAEILSCEDVTYAIGSTSCLAAYWSIGDSTVVDITFYKCSKLIYFGNVFKNDKKRTKVSELLYGCTNITSVDLTPLAGLVNVTNASRLLSGCTNITSVDLTPLASWAKVIYNSSLIVGCSKLIFISVLSTTLFTLSYGALTNGNSCPIYVPDEAVDTYKMATNWSAYASRIKPISEKTES